MECLPPVMPRFMTCTEAPWADAATSSGSSHCSDGIQSLHRQFLRHPRRRRPSWVIRVALAPLAERVRLAPVATYEPTSICSRWAMNRHAKMCASQGVFEDLAVLHDDDEVLCWIFD